MVSGFQDFWVAGSRFYLRRDPIASVEQAWRDVGVLVSANPTSEISKIECKDSDGGVLNTVDERVNEITETYDLEVKNLNMDNLALFFLGSAPESFTQTAEEKLVSHRGVVGSLLKIHDNDADETNLFSLTRITGIITALADLSTDAFTAIDVSTRTITTAGDLSSDLTAGDEVVIRETGLADLTNAGSYTVESVTATEVVTVESFAGADEVAITGSMIYAASGDSGTVYTKDTDWEVQSLDRGFARMIPGGAFAADADVEVIFSTGALTGERLFNPQQQQGEVTGDFMLIYGRGNNAEQTVREGRCSVTPSAANIQVEDYSSITLTITVLSDLTEAVPAGRMLHFKGDVADAS